MGKRVKKRDRAAHPAAQHFVEDHTKGPKIHFKTVIPFKKDLWGREGWCADTAACEVRMGKGVVGKLKCNAKITKNNVTVCVDKDVLGFNVSMYDVMCVDLLNGKELNN